MSVISSGILMLKAGKFGIAFIPTRLAEKIPKKIEEISKIQATGAKETSIDSSLLYGQNGKEIFPENKGKIIDVTV